MTKKIAKSQKILALSMRGGGARTGAYLGALKALEEQKIEVSMLIGSSGGAYVAGLYAAGLTIDQILEHMKGNTRRHYFGINSIRGRALIGDNKRLRHINKAVRDIDIKDTKKKFWIQVTNLGTQSSEILSKGNLAKAIVASGALPILMRPIELDGCVYIDGDVSSGFAVKFLKAQGADLVLGLSCSSYGDQKKKDHFSLVNRAVEPFRISQKIIREMDQKLNPVDLLLDNLGDSEIRIWDYARSEEVMQKGYVQTMEKMDEIKKVL